MEQPTAEPWFSGRPGVIYLFRVNRRERSPQQQLLAREHPSDFDHFVDVLDFGATVQSGRKNKREWHLGNRSVDRERQLLTGRVGYVSSREQLTGRYRSDEQIWEDVLEERDSGTISPFAFDGVTRTLAVVRHPTFSGRTLAEVFTKFLNEGENRQLGPSTNWEVEPILDEQNFYSWLDRTPYVDEIRFVAKLPNPDGLDGLEYINQRMTRIEGGQISERLKARDREVGLRNIQEDDIARGYVDSASNGFGNVAAVGYDEAGKRDTYDQRNQVARASIDEMPGSWADLLDTLILEVLAWRRRRREHDSS